MKGMFKLGGRLANAALLSLCGLNSSAATVDMGEVEELIQTYLNTKIWSVSCGDVSDARKVDGRDFSDFGIYHLYYEAMLIVQMNGCYGRLDNNNAWSIQNDPPSFYKRKLRPLVIGESFRITGVVEYQKFESGLKNGKLIRENDYVLKLHGLGKLAQITEIPDVLEPILIEIVEQAGPHRTYISALCANGQMHKLMESATKLESIRSSSKYVRGFKVGYKQPKWGFIEIYMQNVPIILNSEVSVGAECNGGQVKWSFHHSNVSKRTAARVLAAADEKTAADEGSLQVAPSSVFLHFLDEFPLLSQRNPGNYRDVSVMTVKEPVTGTTRVEEVQNLACLATVYTMIERGQGKIVSIDDYYPDPRKHGGDTQGPSRLPYVGPDEPIDFEKIEEALRAGQPTILRGDGGPYSNISC